MELNRLGQPETFSTCSATDSGALPVGQHSRVFLRLRSLLLQRLRLMAPVVLWKRARLSIDKVVHHDDVIFTVVVRTWSRVSGSDPHMSDQSVVKFDAKEG